MCQQCRAFAALIFCAGNRQLERYGAGWLEAKLDMIEPQQRLRQQPHADQQHHGDRNLRRDESASQTVRPFASDESTLRPCEQGDNIGHTRVHHRKGGEHVAVTEIPNAKARTRASRDTSASRAASSIYGHRIRWNARDAETNDSARDA